MPQPQHAAAFTRTCPKPAGEWVLTLIVLLGTLSIYAATAWLVGRTDSPQHAYFDHLAAAFLDGRTYLTDPPGQSDLTRHGEHWYVPFPPLGAVLLLPSVAALGVDGTNTVAFSIVWGAISVAVVWRILRGLAQRGWIGLRAGDRGWLVLLLALGCVHWYVSIEGSVWFLSHTCTIMFVALAVWAAVAGRSAWICGTLLAIALWGRPNVIFTWPLLLSIAAQHRQDAGKRISRGWLAAWNWRLATPIAASILGLLAYNYARFEDPLDFGYAKQNVDTEVRGDLALGLFHPRHIPGNLRTLLAARPDWRQLKGSPNIKVPVPDDHGMSVFLTTPALLYVVRARRRRGWLIRGAWIATGMLLVPILMYYNAGWRQFGYRFSLDFMIPLMILLASAAGNRVSWPMRVLILLGVLINAWGTAWWFTGWPG